MAENKFDEFIQEVDEELKWEKLEKHFKDYGAYVAGAILAIILGVSGYVYWSYRTHESESAQSDLYSKAATLASEGKIEDANKFLDDLIKQGDEYAMLARFQKAAVLAQKPETREEAMALYKQMIDEHKLDRRYRSLAVIFYVQNQLDSGDAEELMRYLQEISKGSNLWPGITSELMALVAIKLGDVEQARSILQDLVSSQDTASGVRVRANALLSTLNSDSKGE